MRFSLKRLLAFVTLIALICAAPTCWQQIQLQRFRTYIDHDLEKLSEAERKTFVSITDSVLNRPDFSDQPPLMPEPYFLSRLSNGNLILVERSLAGPVPGNSLIRISAIKSNGMLLSQTEFSTGWRIGIVSAKRIVEEFPSDFVFVVNSKPEHAGREVAKQFYAMIDGYPFLLRLEDPFGNPLQNQTRHFKIGPELPPKYDSALVEKLKASLTTKTDNARSGLGPPVSQSSADSVLRAFLNAKATGDLDTLKRYSIDHPELAILCQQSSKSDIGTSHIGIYELAVGDSFALPSGKQNRVSNSMVNEKRKLFATHPTFSPSTLFAAHLIDGHWKIDPEPSIAAQKATNK